MACVVTGGKSAVGRWTPEVMMTVDLSIQRMRLELHGWLGNDYNVLHAEGPVLD